MTRMEKFAIQVIMLPLNAVKKNRTSVCRSVRRLGKLALTRWPHPAAYLTYLSTKEQHERRQIWLT